MRYRLLLSLPFSFSCPFSFSLFIFIFLGGCAQATSAEWACATQYVHLAHGDVGNDVTGDDLRCLFRSTKSSGYPGMPESRALNLLVGRDGASATKAGRSTAFSTALWRVREQR